MKTFITFFCDRADFLLNPFPAFAGMIGRRTAAVLTAAGAPMGLLRARAAPAIPSDGGHTGHHTAVLPERQPTRPPRAVHAGIPPAWTVRLMPFGREPVSFCFSPPTVPARPLIPGTFLGIIL